MEKSYKATNQQDLAREVARLRGLVAAATYAMATHDTIDGMAVIRADRLDEALGFPLCQPGVDFPVRPTVSVPLPILQHATATLKAARSLLTGSPLNKEGLIMELTQAIERLENNSHD